MMMSVLTFCRISGAALASRTVKASMVCLPVSDRTPIKSTNIGDVAGDGGGRGHRRTRQVRAPARPLPADEVAVGGRDAALAGCDRVAIHRQAHRAAGLAPIEAGGEEDAVHALRPRPAPCGPRAVPGPR